MTPKSLWGELPVIDAIRTPTQILKEQASALEDMTKGALRGDVTVKIWRNSFAIELDIVAPAVDNYTYNVLVASHGVQLYPVTVNAGSKNFECPDEESFESALHTILTSAEVKRVISTLLAQSRAM